MYCLSNDVLACRVVASPFILAVAESILAVAESILGVADYVLVLCALIFVRW